MTLGEGGSALIFAALAFFSIVAAAKSIDAPFAFHAYLTAAASVAAVIAILNRYYARPAALPPAEIDGKPNYNMGPVKFATAAAVFWGVAGFTVGLIIALQLTYPVLNAARKVLFLVSGAGKAPALAAVVAGGKDAPPAAGVRPERGELLWFVDEAAAGELP